MSIEIINETIQGNNIYGADIPVGQAFFANIANHNNELFLRTFNGIVSLTSPTNTWTGSYPTVHNYQPVDVMITIIGDTKEHKAEKYVTCSTWPKSLLIIKYEDGSCNLIRKDGSTRGYDWPENIDKYTENGDWEYIDVYEAEDLLSYHIADKSLLKYLKDLL